MGRSKAERKARRVKRKKARRVRRMVMGLVILVVPIGILLYIWTRPPLPEVGDHWHATLAIDICGKREPPLPPSPGGIHSHGNEYQIHIHPASRAQSGAQSNLGRFFDGLGLRFSESTIELPGGRFYNDGDSCPNGAPGHLTVRVNGRVTNDPRSYVPRDGDRIEIRFGS